MIRSVILSLRRGDLAFRELGERSPFSGGRIRAIIAGVAVVGRERIWAGLHMRWIRDVPG